MSVHPTLKYNDANAAIAFLTGTLGFTEVQVSRNETGAVMHAELAHGDGVVLIGTRTEPGGQFDTGKAVLYLVVTDVDAHHDKAVAAGAKVVYPLVDQPYGSREYAVSDAEGNIWSVGTYRPAAAG